MTPTEAWAVVRPDGTVYRTFAEMTEIDRAAWMLSGYDVVRIEEVRE